MFHMVLKSVEPHCRELDLALKSQVRVSFVGLFRRWEVVLL